MELMKYYSYNNINKYITNKFSAKIRKKKIPKHSAYLHLQKHLLKLVRNIKLRNIKLQYQQIY